ncbi:MAG: HAD family hydrolase [Finegoldia sp.]|nr:HAD family hydrolase [Finegoldia sp.]
MKVKIYDFDGTIIKGDSIFVLLKFLRKKGKISIFTRIGYIFKSVYAYLKEKNFEAYKNSWVAMAQRLSKEEMEEFVDILLRDYGYKNIIKDIKEDGYISILCSSSIEDYLDIVGEKLSFDYVLGTRTGEGKVLGKNNSKKEKARRLEELFNREGILVSYDESKAYTDRFDNDSWMCSFVKNKYLVNSIRKLDGFENIEGIV